MEAQRLIALHCCTQIVIATVATCGATRADEVLYRYDANTFPDHPSADWIVANPCEMDCVQSLEDGQFVLEWNTIGGDFVNYDHVFPEPPDPLWVEWRFRSNFPFPPTDAGCDGAFRIGNLNILFMHGDLAFEFGTNAAIGDLSLDEFHSYRFERHTGDVYTFSVDGQLIVSRIDSDPSNIVEFLQMRGRGECNRPPGVVQRNAWDHVWYGTIGEREAIVNSDPPQGIIDANVHSDLDRFTISFNQPGYVYVDDITVEVFSSIGNRQSTFGNPVVLWTKRLDNGEPDTVEIILDQALPLGMTTRFTFNTGGSPNTVEYTYLLLGTCCLSDGSCLDSDGTDCGELGGAFTAGATCGQPAACCISNNSCVEVDPLCCPIVGDPTESLFGNGGGCEGDGDGDGVDGICGDECPFDPDKTEPGQCGCDEPDSDSDFDTVADCADQCPGVDDRIDQDGNGVPDCAQFQPIPTTTAWGLVILGLILITLAKVRSIRRVISA